MTLDSIDLAKTIKTYIIAEMSANHMQNLTRARQIIAEAKQAGADAIKIQTYKPNTITIDCYGE